MKDIYQHKNSQNITIIIFLDFSKAFDTINHQLIKQKLLTQFNFSNEAANWVYSYLTSRYQAVQFDNIQSQFMIQEYRKVQFLGLLFFL